MGDGMSAGFTPGPWVQCADPRFVDGPDRALVAQAETVADARLIAALPDTLSALESVWDWMSEVWDKPTQPPLDLYHVVEAALAKARGETA
jgi:hypothetical protein